jgi:predicted dienelactone hydrolase
VLALVLAAALAVLAGATASHLRLPEPGGEFAVGRDRLAWTDADRPELHTPDPSDRRAVAAQIWFPAAAGTGQPGPYLSGLGAIAQTLVDSGEVTRLQAWGLRWVRHHALDGAAVSTAEPAYPVVVLSPGNATNVAFYATLGEHLASRGYVVVGVDHPYQVAAVQLPDGTVAGYDSSADAATSPGAGRR